MSLPNVLKIFYDGALSRNLIITSWDDERPLITVENNLRSHPSLTFVVHDSKSTGEIDTTIGTVVIRPLASTLACDLHSGKTKHPLNVQKRGTFHSRYQYTDPLRGLQMTWKKENKVLLLHGADGVHVAAKFEYKDLARGGVGRIEFLDQEKSLAEDVKYEIIITGCAIVENSRRKKAAAISGGAGTVAPAAIGVGVGAG